jgi:hypothetical protein
MLSSYFFAINLPTPIYGGVVLTLINYPNIKNGFSKGNPDCF